MNRRDFLAVVSGAGVASLAGIRPAFAASEQTTSLYLEGLVMVSFEDPVLRIGFPKAAGHKATLQIVPVNGKARTMTLKGNANIETKAAGTVKPMIKVPELVRISEFYGPQAKSKFAEC